MAQVKGIAQFETDRCKGCGLCVAVCPLELLTLDEKNVNVKGYLPSKVKDSTKCIGCGQCALMCPDSIIMVKRFKHMRSTWHA